MEIVIILSLILLNGLFSMSEIALVSARKSRLESEAKKGSKRAKAALTLAEEPNKFLSTVQIGITLIGILTGLYSGEAFAGRLAHYLVCIPFVGPYASQIATVCIVFTVTFLTIVWGELIPKRVGLSAAERISKHIAGPMLVLSAIMTPMVWILSQSTTLVLKLMGIKEDGEKITEEEIKSIVKEGVHTGEVLEVEHDIVERVFSLGDRTVASIMTYRRDLVWLDITDDLVTVNKKIKENMHTLYPVCDGDAENIVGVVYTRDLFGLNDAAVFSLNRLVTKAQFVTENLSVYKALELFKKTNFKYGLISDEFGAVQGIVTLTDIMEALVGEMPEVGEKIDIIKREDGSLLVDGQCPFYNFLEYLDMQALYAEYDHNTLSGLILELLEHIPHEGEKLIWHRLNFEIVDMDGARIDKVLVTVEPQ